MRILGLAPCFFPGCKGLEGGGISRVVVVGLGGPLEFEWGTPRVGGGTLRMGGGTPRMEGETPRMGGGTPRLGGETLEWDGGDPRMGP